MKTKRIISLVVAILFFVNNISYALGPSITSGNLAEETRPGTKDAMYTLGQKLFAAKVGPGAIDFDNLLGPATFRGIDLWKDLITTTTAKYRTKFIEADYDKLPADWEKNNPILGQKNLITALKMFRGRARISSSKLEIKEGWFPIDEKAGELPIARIEPLGGGKYVLIVHTKFVQMWNHIRKNDVWFEVNLTPKDKRTVSVAWGIFYRVAKYEMAELSKRDGAFKSLGHMAYNLLFPHDDEGLANTIGGNYATLNDTIWMWFLGSYSFENSTRYNNFTFLNRLEWFFKGEEALQKGLHLEFPNLLKNSNKRLSAMAFACAINQKFFYNRPGAEVPKTYYVNSKFIEQYDDRRSAGIKEKSLYATGGGEDEKSEATKPQEHKTQDTKLPDTTSQVEGKEETREKADSFKTEEEIKDDSVPTISRERVYKDVSYLANHLTSGFFNIIIREKTISLSPSRLFVRVEAKVGASYDFGAPALTTAILAKQGKNWKRTFPIGTSEEEIVQRLLEDANADNQTTPKDKPHAKLGKSPDDEQTPPMGGGMNAEDLAMFAKNNTPELLVKYIIDTGLSLQLDIVRKALKTDKQKLAVFEKLLAAKTGKTISKVKEPAIAEKPSAPVSPAKGDASKALKILESIGFFTSQDKTMVERAKEKLRKLPIKDLRAAQRALEREDGKYGSSFTDGDLQPKYSVLMDVIEEKLSAVLPTTKATRRTRPGKSPEDLIRLIAFKNGAGEVLSAPKLLEWYEDNYKALGFEKPAEIRSSALQTIRRDLYDSGNSLFTRGLIQPQLDLSLPTSSTNPMNQWKKGEKGEYLFKVTRKGYKEVLEARAQAAVTPVPPAGEEEKADILTTLKDAVNSLNEKDIFWFDKDGIIQTVKGETVSPNTPIGYLHAKAKEEGKTYMVIPQKHDVRHQFYALPDVTAMDFLQFVVKNIPFSKAKQEVKKLIKLAESAPTPATPADEDVTRSQDTRAQDTRAQDTRAQVKEVFYSEDEAKRWVEENLLPQLGKLKAEDPDVVEKNIKRQSLNIIQRIPKEIDIFWAFPKIFQERCKECGGTWIDSWGEIYLKDNSKIATTKNKLSCTRGTIATLSSMVRISLFKTKNKIIEGWEEKEFESALEEFWTIEYYPQMKSEILKALSPEKQASIRKHFSGPGGAIEPIVPVAPENIIQTVSPTQLAIESLSEIVALIPQVQREKISAIHVFPYLSGEGDSRQETGIGLFGLTRLKDETIKEYTEYALGYREISKGRNYYITFRDHGYMGLGRLGNFYSESSLNDIYVFKDIEKAQKALEVLNEFFKTHGKIDGFILRIKPSGELPSKDEISALVAGKIKSAVQHTKPGKSPEDLIRLIGFTNIEGEILSTPILLELYKKYHKVLGFDPPAKEDASALQTIRRDLYDSGNSLFARGLVKPLLDLSLPTSSTNPRSQWMKGKNGEYLFEATKNCDEAYDVRARAQGVVAPSSVAGGASGKELWQLSQGELKTAFSMAIEAVDDDIMKLSQQKPRGLAREKMGIDKNAELTNHLNYKIEERKEVKKLLEAGLKHIPSLANIVIQATNNERMFIKLMNYSYQKEITEKEISLTTVSDNDPLGTQAYNYLTNAKNQLGSSKQNIQSSVMNEDVTRSQDTRAQVGDKEETKIQETGGKVAVTPSEKPYNSASPFHIGIVTPISLKNYGELLNNEGFEQSVLSNIKSDLLIPQTNEPLSQFADRVNKNKYDVLIVQLHGAFTEAPVAFENYKGRLIVLVHRPEEVLARGEEYGQRLSKLFNKAERIVLLGDAMVGEFKKLQNGAFDKKVSVVPHGFFKVSNTEPVEKKLDYVAYGSVTTWSDMRWLKDLEELRNEINKKKHGEKIFAFASGKFVPYTNPVTGEAINELEKLKANNECVIIGAGEIEHAFQSGEFENNLTSWKSWLYGKSEEGKKIVVVLGDFSTAETGSELKEMQASVVDGNIQMYRERLKQFMPKVEYSGTLHENPGNSIPIVFRSSSMTDVSSEGLYMIQIDYDAATQKVKFDNAAEDFLNLIRHPDQYNKKLRQNWQNSHELTMARVAEKYGVLALEVARLQNEATHSDSAMKFLTQEELGVLFEAQQKGEWEIIQAKQTELRETLLNTYLRKWETYKEQHNLVRPIFDITNPNQQRHIITSAEADEYNLEGHLAEFIKKSDASTAGIRAFIDLVHSENPTKMYNDMFVTLMLEAEAEFLKEVHAGLARTLPQTREGIDKFVAGLRVEMDPDVVKVIEEVYNMPLEGIIPFLRDNVVKLVGGEVRVHTGKFVEMESRILAAKGIKVITLERFSDSVPIYIYSFLTYLLGANGATHYTSSHSANYLFGRKSLAPDGAQLLPDVYENYRRILKRIIEEEIYQKGSHAVELSHRYNPNIISRLNYNRIAKLYRSILNITPQEVYLINKATRQGHRIVLNTLNGSTWKTIKPLFAEIGIDTDVFHLVMEDEDSLFSAGYIVTKAKDGSYSVDHLGIDTTLNKVVQTIPYNKMLKGLPVGTRIYECDPDSDRFVVKQIVSDTPENAKLLKEYAITSYKLDEGKILIAPSPNKAFLVLDIVDHEIMRGNGTWEQFWSIYYITYVSTRAWVEFAESVPGLIRVMAQVGFKNLTALQRELENWYFNHLEEKEFTFHDQLGRKITVSRDRKIRIHSKEEESGGRVAGMNKPAINILGQKVLAMPEKSAADGLLSELVFSSRLYLDDKTSMQGRYLFLNFMHEAFERYGLKSKVDVRLDIEHGNQGEIATKPYNEQQKALEQADIIKTNFNNFFFSLGRAVRDNKITIEKAREVLSAVLPRYKDTWSKLTEITLTEEVLAQGRTRPEGVPMIFSEGAMVTEFDFRPSCTDPLKSKIYIDAEGIEGGQIKEIEATFKDITSYNLYEVLKYYKISSVTPEPDWASAGINLNKLKLKEDANEDVVKKGTGQSTGFSTESKPTGAILEKLKKMIVRNIRTPAGEPLSAKIYEILFEYKAGNIEEEKAVGGLTEELKKSAYLWAGEGIDLITWANLYITKVKGMYLAMGDINEPSSQSGAENKSAKPTTLKETVEFLQEIMKEKQLIVKIVDNPKEAAELEQQHPGGVSTWFPLISVSKNTDPLYLLIVAFLSFELSPQAEEKIEAKINELEKEWFPAGTLMILKEAAKILNYTPKWVSHSDFVVTKEYGGDDEPDGYFKYEYRNKIKVKIKEPSAKKLEGEKIIYKKRKWQSFLASSTEGFPYQTRHIFYTSKSANWKNLLKSAFSKIDEGNQWKEHVYARLVKLLKTKSIQKTILSPATKAASRTKPDKSPEDLIRLIAFKGGEGEIFSAPKLLEWYEENYEALGFEKPSEIRSSALKTIRRDLYGLKNSLWMQGLLLTKININRIPSKVNPRNRWIRGPKHEFLFKLTEKGYKDVAKVRAKEAAMPVVRQVELKKEIENLDEDIQSTRNDINQIRSKISDLERYIYEAQILEIRPSDRTLKYVESLNDTINKLQYRISNYLSPRLKELKEKKQRLEEQLKSTSIETQSAESEISDEDVKIAKIEKAMSIVERITPETDNNKEELIKIKKELRGIDSAIFDKILNHFGSSRRAIEEGRLRLDEKTLTIFNTRHDILLDVVSGRPLISLNPQDMAMSIIKTQKPIFIRANIDVIKKAKVKDAAKLEDIYNFLKEALENYSLVIHGFSGRPWDKDFDKEAISSYDYRYVHSLSLLPVVEWYAEKLAQERSSVLEEVDDVSVSAHFKIEGSQGAEEELHVILLRPDSPGQIGDNNDIIASLVGKAGYLVFRENRRFDQREQNKESSARSEAIQELIIQTSILPSNTLIAMPHYLRFLYDIGINVDTASAHRAEATNVEIAGFIPVLASEHIEKFTKSTTDIRSSLAGKKLTAIIAGAKRDKLDLAAKSIGEMVFKGSEIVIEGPIIAAFLKLEGKSIGAMEVTDKDLEAAERLLKKAGKEGVGYFIPYNLKVIPQKEIKDAVAGDIREVTDGNIPEGYIIADTGKKDLEWITAILSGSEAIFQSGMISPQDLNSIFNGNEILVKAMAAQARKGKVVVNVGADTYKGNKIAGVTGQFTQAAEGGAFLSQVISGEPLPGIKAIKDSQKKFSERIKELLGDKSASNAAGGTSEIVHSETVDAKFVPKAEGVTIKRGPKFTVEEKEAISAYLKSHSPYMYSEDIGFSFGNTWFVFKDNKVVGHMRMKLDHHNKQVGIADRQVEGGFEGIDEKLYKTVRAALKKEGWKIIILDSYLPEEVEFFRKVVGPENTSGWAYPGGRVLWWDNLNRELKATSHETTKVARRTKPGKSPEDLIRLIAFKGGEGQVLSAPKLLEWYEENYEALGFEKPAEIRNSALRTIERDLYGFKNSLLAQGLVEPQLDPNRLSSSTNPMSQWKRGGDGGYLFYLTVKGYEKAAKARAQTATAPTDKNITMSQVTKSQVEGEGETKEKAARPMAKADIIKWFEETISSVKTTFGAAITNKEKEEVISTLTDKLDQIKEMFPESIGSKFQNNPEKIIEWVKEGDISGAAGFLKEYRDWSILLLRPLYPASAAGGASEAIRSPQRPMEVPSVVEGSTATRGSPERSRGVYSETVDRGPLTVDIKSSRPIEGLPRNDLERLVKAVLKNRKEELIKSESFDSLKTDDGTDELMTILSIKDDQYDWYYSFDESKRNKKTFLDWLAYLAGPVLRETREVKPTEKEIDEYAEAVYELLAETKRQGNKETTSQDTRSQGHRVTTSQVIGSPILSAISEYVIDIGLDIGPGRVESTPQEIASFYPVYETLSHQTVEIYLPQAARSSLTDAVKQEITNLNKRIRERTGRKDDAISFKAYDANNLETLLNNRNEGAKRIFVNDNTMTEAFKDLLNQDKAAVLKGNRLITTSIPQAQDKKELSVYQAWLVKVALLSAMVEESNMSTVGSALREELKDRVDSDINISEFITNLAGTENEKVEAVAARINYFLGKIVKLSQFIGEQIRILKAFWTAA